MWSISSTFYGHIFLYKSLFGSFFYLHVTREKAAKKTFYKKFARKMLMKFTHDMSSFCKCRFTLLFGGHRAQTLSKSFSWVDCGVGLNFIAYIGEICVRMCQYTPSAPGANFTNILSHILCTKVPWAAFMSLKYGFVIFC